MLSETAALSADPPAPTGSGSTFPNRGRPTPWSQQAHRHCYLPSLIRQIFTNHIFPGLCHSLCSVESLPSRKKDRGFGHGLDWFSRRRSRPPGCWTSWRIRRPIGMHPVRRIVSSVAPVPPLVALPCALTTLGNSYLPLLARPRCLVLTRQPPNRDEDGSTGPPGHRARGLQLQTPVCPPALTASISSAVPNPPRRRRPQVTIRPLIHSWGSAEDFHQGRNGPSYTNRLPRPLLCPLCHAAGRAWTCRFRAPDSRVRSRVPESSEPYPSARTAEKSSARAARRPIPDAAMGGNVSIPPRSEEKPETTRAHGCHLRGPSRSSLGALILAASTIAVRYTRVPP